MQFKWLDQEMKYDGSQLHSLFAYLNYGILGNSVVAWMGSCNVLEKNIVDGEDLLSKSKICGDQMVHFIVEVFEEKLRTAVVLQRLFAGLARDTLYEFSSSLPEKHPIRREGDDLFIYNRKLSISVATVSPVSALIHFAVNVVTDGTPVETSCLNEIGVEPKPFSLRLMERFVQESRSIDIATRKVLAVR